MHPYGQFSIVVDWELLLRSRLALHPYGQCSIVVDWELLLTSRLALHPTVWSQRMVSLRHQLLVETEMVSVGGQCDRAAPVLPQQP